LAAAPIAALAVAAEGRVPVVRVDEASDTRGAARVVVEDSAAGRVVRGRFAALVVVDGASD
jgi:predicted amidohydrolase YtcJ